MTSVCYNQVRQKGSHNSYQRTEGYPDQALYWRIRSLEIDIHNSNNGAYWPPLDSDWYVYHMSVVDQGSSVNRLSDALDVLHSFHLAVPDHEVITVWLDLKDSFTTSGNHTPEALDQLLAARLGRAAIWGPPDLIGEAANLQAAVATSGWPPLDRLRGKFIIACTTGDLSSPTSHLNQYVDNGKTANQRLAFVAPEITSDSQITQFDYAVFFNLDSNHTSLGNAISMAGFISRAYGLNDQKSWCSAWKARVNHLTTDKINAFVDEWARTDSPETGYPFTAIDSPTAGHLIEPGALSAITVTSGDIWDKNDSCYFRYDDKPPAGGSQVAYVGNPTSHVNGWIKAGIMVRASSADNAAYIAILRTGSNGLRMQYRRDNGQKTEAIDAQIPLGGNGKPLVGENTPIWIRLEVGNDGKSATAFYSIDGANWLAVGSASVDNNLALQGWVASSHGAGPVKWLFGGAAVPANGVAIGAQSSSDFTSNPAAAASLGPKPGSANCG